MARFLDARDMKQEALEIATDPDYRFDLAVSLGELGIALELAEVSGSELKWRQLGELALSAGKLQVLAPGRPRQWQSISRMLCAHHCLIDGSCQRWLVRCCQMHRICRSSAHVLCVTACFEVVSVKEHWVVVTLATRRTLACVTHHLSRTV